jgi:hypothetical protein
MTADPSKPNLSTTGCLLRIAVALFAVVAVVGCAAGGYFFRNQQTNRQALAAEVQAIRDAGEPLDGADLNKFYRVPEGEVDITAEWTAALQPFFDNEPLGHKNWALKELLTIDNPGLAPPHRPDPWPQLAAAEQELEPYREALAKLVEAGRKTGSVRYPIDCGWGQNLGLPHLHAANRAAPALQLQGLCHYHQGEMTQAADDVITLIQLAETLRQEPVIMSQAERNSYLRKARELIVYLAADQSFPEEELARIQAALIPVEFESTQVPDFLGERALGYQTYSRPFDPKLKDVRPGRQMPLPIAKGTVVLESRPGDAARFLYWWRRSIEAARLPLREAIDAGRKIEQEILAEAQAEARLPKSLQNRVCQRDVFSPWQSFAHVGRMTTELRALVAFCAIERFRRAEKRMPESLAELVPKYLADVPVDPFSEQPLTFLPPGVENVYVIYSYGLDGKDDRGLDTMSFHATDYGVSSFLLLPKGGPGGPGPAPGPPLFPPTGQAPGAVRQPAKY